MQNAPPVQDLIAARQTSKVLRDPNTRLPLTDSQQTALATALEAMLAAAHQAPFHKAAHGPSHCQGGLASIVPWRAYLIDQATCWQLIDRIAERAKAEPESTWAKAQGSKIPPLLSAAVALIQVNWCPNRADDGSVPLNTANAEHIAAAAAAVQNMLLSASHHGIANYWSTGGILREPALQAMLGIEPGGQPLASIFLSFPTDGDTIKTGAMRDLKGSVADWSKRVSLT